MLTLHSARVTGSHLLSKQTSHFEFWFPENSRLLLLVMYFAKAWQSCFKWKEVIWLSLVLSETLVSTSYSKSRSSLWSSGGIESWSSWKKSLIHQGSHRILSAPKKGSCYYSNIIMTRKLTKPNKIWHSGKKIYPRDKRGLHSSFILTTCL